MRDETIIVDGIEVSNCEHCVKGAFNILCQQGGVLTESTFCDSNPNCYFKQKERYWKEKEDIKDELIKKTAEVNELSKGLEDFDYEVAQLQEKIHTLIMAIKVMKDLTGPILENTPEYNDCYHKNECGDKCYPKRANKVDVCLYEKVETLIAFIDHAIELLEGEPEDEMDR